MKFLLNLFAISLLVQTAQAAGRSSFSVTVSGSTDRSRIERASDINPSFSVDSTSGSTVMGNFDFNFTPSFALFAFGGTTAYNYESNATRTVNENDGSYTTVGGGLKFTFGDFAFTVHATQKPLLVLEDITSSENTVHQVDNAYAGGSLKFGASSTYYELALKLEGGSGTSEPTLNDLKVTSIGYFQGEMSLIFGGEGKSGGISKESDFIYGATVRLREESYQYNDDTYTVSDFGGGVFIALN